MNLEKELKTYLLEALGAEAAITPMGASFKVPRFLEEIYTCKNISIQDRRYLLAFLNPGQEITPGSVKKHMERLQELTMQDAVFVSNDLPGWNRKRFIEHKIPFIIPGKQMYLPLAGLDLREYTKKARLPKTRERLSPATQEIALYVLGKTNAMEWTASQLAEERGLSLMTIHRVLDELKHTDGFTVTMRGKRRILQTVQNRRETWENLKALSQNPAARTVIIPTGLVPPFAVEAGLTAMATVTDLAHPDIPSFAVKMSDWNTYAKGRKVPLLPAADSGTVRLELWRYEPRFDTESTMADILSVCLTLENTEDERVAQAIDRVLKESLC